MAELTGAEELRRVVSVLNNVRESFNDMFTAEQLLQLVRMMLASGWDIYPDEWHWDQVHAALDGYAPQWDPTTEQPLLLRWQGPWQSAAAYTLDDPRIIDVEYPELDEPEY